MNLEKIGLQVPEILLPGKRVDLHKWSVVACDQYTSQPEYWTEVGSIVGSEPSTLKIVFPEVYLEDSDGDQRILSINETMQNYLDDGTLQSMANKGFVLVDRKTSQATSRKGLVVAIDLEQYDFTKSAKTLIRATEGTIVDRLPPRIKVRENAAIELPHIMVLIDDPDRTVIEPLFEQQPEPLYDFELMQNGGHVKGFAIDRPELIQQVTAALENLASREVFSQKYDAEGKDVMLYAMGDGNHSLATAKAIWNKIKEDSEDQATAMTNPARYALVELVNIHDDGLQFEAIHRVAFNIDPAQLLQDMQAFFKNKCTVTRCNDENDMLEKAQSAGNKDRHIVPFVDLSGYGYITFEDPKYTLELATLESFLNDYLEQHDGKVDFIHGDEVVKQLGCQPGNIGFFFPPISKHGFFKTIIFDGAMPRKTFSLGEADEKRFYLEARKIK